MESYLKFPEFRSPLADIIYGLCEKRVILKSRVTMDAIALTPTGLPPVFVMPEANVGWVRLGEVRPKEPSLASNIVHGVKEIPFPKEDLETLTKGNTSKDNYLSPDAQYEFKAVKTKAKSAKNAEVKQLPFPSRLNRIALAMLVAAPMSASGQSTAVHTWFNRWH